MVQFSALLQNQEQWQPVLNRLPSILSLILVIACAQLLAQLTWILIPQAEQAPVTFSQNTGKSSAKQPSHNIDDLTRANLFGKPGKQVNTNTKKAPDTQLNLVLRGVLASGDPDVASAIIAQGSNGKEDIYSVGDKLPGGVSIEEIHAEFVILSRQGRLEKLRLIKDKGIELAPSRSVASDNKTGGKQSLKDVRATIMKNPTSFGDYALPVAVNEKGKLVGYRLQPQKKGAELMKQAGMLPTDIITSINGIKLDKPENGIGALRKLTNAKEVDLMVKRNGSEIPLHISLQ